MIVSIVISIILSLFSTAVMSYVATATPIGPWIAPTLVLVAFLLFKLFLQKKVSATQLALVTSAGSVGGILATAVGFSYPTLYFLEPELFDSWVAQPFYFALILSAVAASAGLFGFWIANLLEHKLIIEEQLSFPIAPLVYKTIEAAHEVKKTVELMAGFVGTSLYCLLQNGIFGLRQIIPSSITLISKMSFKIITVPYISINMRLLPMFWAIGFVTGHVIAIPLLIGALSQIFVINPLNKIFFETISRMDFIMAFCSGIVLSGALMGFIYTPIKLYKTIKNFFTNKKKGNTNIFHNVSMRALVEFGILLGVIFFSLSYFKFSLLSQGYLLLFTFICTYQVLIIAGKIGLAQLGRFATFIMVPGMLLFKLSMIQIVIVSTFVEICAGVATDIMFGRKLGHLANIDQKKMQWYQLGGLFISVVSIGIIFWLLVSQFQLGSSELCANRSQARALLINVRQFNLYILVLGFIFGWLLKQIKISPMLVLGGLLMPIQLTLMLVIGGLNAMLCKEKERYYPFWSGVFAANSIWVVIQGIINAVC